MEVLGLEGPGKAAAVAAREDPITFLVAVELSVSPEVEGRLGIVPVVWPPCKVEGRADVGLFQAS